MILSINRPFANIYKYQNLRSEVVTQMIYGEKFIAQKKYGNFFKGYKEYDGYKGYIRSNEIRIFKERPTHKIVVGKCNVYKKPSKKYKLKIEFFLNSRIRIKKSKNNFYQFDKFWIEKNNIKPIHFKEKKFINVAKKFLGTKYLWGGNTKKGIDCSALVQESLKTMNIYCPRDSGDQRIFFKKNINVKNIRSGDLLFWKGHVAVALNKKKLIHAFGPKKKVVIMDIQKTIQSILKNSSLKLLNIKRVPTS